MAKVSHLDKAIASIKAEIAVLQAALVWLEGQRAQAGRPAKAESGA